MRNISLQLSENTSNNVSGINRNSSSRGSIRISPPVAPSNDMKASLRTHASNVIKSDCDQQSCSKNSNSISQSLQNKALESRPTHLIDSVSNYSYPYYDSNNYYTHSNTQPNKLCKTVFTANQSINPSTNICQSSGHSASTSATAVNNSTTSANISCNHRSNSRGSLEDGGVDVGRVSPSSSSNDSRKSRYSSASLDSGRGSDTKTSGQSHRVSVHSCESLGSSSSHKDIYNRNSSSSSSIGSGNSATLDGEISTINTPTATDINWSAVGASVGAINGSLSIAEMVLHGIADEEIIHSWLSKIHFEEYANNFIQAGYDMPTISRMTPEDLTAIGITKPANRRTLKAEIQKLSIADGIPNFKPNTLLEWLKLLRLEEYFNILCQQGYDSIDRVTELAWEDLEEVGITKLGHQKKIMLAIKRIQSVNNNMSHSLDASNSLSLPLIYTNTGSCPDMMSRSQNNSYQLSMHPQCQDVAIKMFAPTKSTPSPTSETPTITTQLRTFQQLPNKSFMFNRQKSEGFYCGLAHNDTQNSVFQSSRGRSLESLDNNETNYYQMYCGKQNQRHAFNMSPNLKHMQFSETEMNHIRDNDKIHGYETDSEIINSFSNNKKCLYEIDGTATLHRPKGLIKAKPIAKIVAKTRQTETNSFNPMYCNDEQKTNFSQINSSFEKRFDSVPQTENNYISGDNESNNYFQDLSSSQIYSSLKRKKTPPPPPKRVNSMRNSSISSPLYSGTKINSYNNSNQHSAHRENYQEFNEQVFATCVKSLASRFSINNSDDIKSTSKNSFDNSNEFPPPPSPLPFNDCQNIKDSYNTLQRRRNNDFNQINSPTESMSSSTESMPFAHDNIGTIKQRVNNESVNKESHSPSPSFASTSAPSSMTSSPSSSIPYNNISVVFQDSLNKNSADSKLIKKTLSPTKHTSRQSPVELNDRSGDNILPEAANIRADPLDDIETMLVNLSNQLDLMLESNNHND